jgi:hypothetical protein
MAGLGEEKIWKDVKGQSILGQDEFIKRFLNSERFIRNLIFVSAISSPIYYN